MTTLEQTLHQASSVVVSCSGGIDSFRALMAARVQWPDHQLIIHHQFLHEDWPQTDSVLQIQARAIGNCKIVTTQVIYELNGKEFQQKNGATTFGTHLKGLHVVRDGDTYYGPLPADDRFLESNRPISSVEGQPITSLLELAAIARGAPPTTKLRFCTDYMKIVNCNRWLNENIRWLGDCVLITGERHAESPNRAKLPEWQWRFSRETPRDVCWWRPIIHMPFHQVVRDILDQYDKEVLHPCYFIQGETVDSMLDPNRDEHGRARCSCIYCIYTREKHLLIAQNNAPELVNPHLARMRAAQSLMLTPEGRPMTWRQSGDLII